jgi:hypothetical protein
MTYPSKFFPNFQQSMSIHVLANYLIEQFFFLTSRENMIKRSRCIVLGEILERKKQINFKFLNNNMKEREPLLCQ